ncbi:MAG: hypothetical protein M1376_15335 [Planctomycetes bacterium]|nr:hypothetical protein [Planctomycetota bacterium]
MTPQYLRLGGVVLGSLAVLIGVAVGLRGCSTQTAAVPWVSGTTIIPGTFGWDAETNSIVDPLRVAVADFWWEMVSEKERYLTAMHDAAAALVRGKSYEQIDAAYVSRRRLQTTKIDAGDKAGVLDPGTIVVFRTADGTLGKLQIVGYRRLHDLSFPQAGAYLDTSKTAISQHADIERGHLEIKWQFYRAPLRPSECRAR